MTFLDRKAASEPPWTKQVLRLPHRQAHREAEPAAANRALDEFVACYRSGDRHDRAPTWSEYSLEGRWACTVLGVYRYEEIVA